MTLGEKIANSVPKLEKIDSSIDSCIKILEQELEKRKVEDPESQFDIYQMLVVIGDLKRDFNIMRGKK